MNENAWVTVAISSKMKDKLEEIKEDGESFESIINKLLVNYAKWKKVQRLL